MFGYWIMHYEELLNLVLNSQEYSSTQSFVSWRSRWPREQSLNGEMGAGEFVDGSILVKMFVDGAQN